MARRGLLNHQGGGQPRAQALERELAVARLAAGVLGGRPHDRAGAAQMRRFCSSVRVADASTSKDASTREAVTFACWPPGPDERLTRSSISESGSSTSRAMRSDSSIGPPR